MSEDYLYYSGDSSLSDGENGAVMKRFDQIDYNIDSLFERIEAFQNLESLSKTVQRQAELIDNLTDDMAFKSNLPLYRLMIEYVDILGDMLRRQDHLLDSGESLEYRFNTLFGAVEELQKYMVTQLENHQVETFEDVVDDPLNVSERQEIVERQVEENENEFLRYGENVDTFYKTSLPGYIYRKISSNEAADQSAEIVIRPEKIIKVVKDAPQF